MLLIDNSHHYKQSLLIWMFFVILMNTIYSFITATTIIATLLLIVGNSGLQHANASFCPGGQNIAICQGPYKLPQGVWQFEANGTVGTLNISSVKITGNVNGTLQFIDTSGVGKLCVRTHPCNINGTFNSFTGKINLTSTPTIPTFAADIQNYTGYVTSKTIVDITFYHIAGLGSIVKPQPVKEFEWSASKSCLVTGCIG
jgi:hypothetical protein